MVCLALVLVAFAVKCSFDAATERLRREHLRMTSRPVSPYSAHWYLGADNQSHLLPGHRNPYEEGDGEGELASGVGVASTLPSVVSTASTRPGGSAEVGREAGTWPE